MSFGLQYPRVTTQAWLHATLLHWCLVNFLFAPLKIGFFAVALPKLICGKLRRLRHPKRAVGSFPFRAPMRDSAVDYVAARHAHLPLAKFLLRRQGYNSGATGEPPTPPHLAGFAEVAAAGRTAGPSPTACVVPPPSPPLLAELLHLGDTHSDSDEGSALPDRGRTRRARSHGLPRRACSTTLALFVLSLVLCMPAQLQEIVVDEVIVVLVSLGMVAALEVTHIARWIAAAYSDLVHAHGAAAVAATLAAAATAVGLCLLVRRAARDRGRALRRAEDARLSSTYDAEVHGTPRAWCWPAMGGRADAAAPRVASVGSQGTPTQTHKGRSVRVAPT